MSLEDVKVGDVLAVLGWYRRDLSKQVVVRVTATQVATNEGERFLRRGGRKVGSGNSGSRTVAAPWDEAEHGPRLEKQRAAALRERLSRRLVEHVEIPLERLKRIEAILDEGKEPAP